MIKHIVMWSLKETADGRSKAENMKIMRDMLEALKDKIPEVIKIEVGFNLVPSNMSFDLALYSEFKDEAALEVYQKHPEHLVVKEFVSKVVEKRGFVDYKV